MGLAPFLPEKPKIVKVCLPDFSESNLRYLQQIANEPRLQISLIVSVQNLTSKNYRFCKLITDFNHPDFVVI